MVSTGQARQELFGGDRVDPALQSAIKGLTRPVPLARRFSMTRGRIAGGERPNSRRRSRRIREGNFIFAKQNWCLRRKRSRTRATRLRCFKR